MLTRRFTLPGIPVQTPPKKLLPRAERRASILQGAAAAFARAGFANTSMDDVAAACGVTKLIVYRHFETKEELYRAILQQVVDRAREELAQGLAAASSSRGTGARSQLTVARENPDGYRLLWHHAAREPMFAPYAAEVRAAATGVVRHLAAIDVGDPVVDQWQAEVLLAYLVDATLAWLDNGDPARDEDAVERITVGLHALHSAWSPR